MLRYKRVKFAYKTQVEQYQMKHLSVKFKCTNHCATIDRCVDSLEMKRQFVISRKFYGR